MALECVVDFFTVITHWKAEACEDCSVISESPSLICISIQKYKFVYDIDKSNNDENFSFWGMMPAALLGTLFSQHAMV